jgi:hypothetical protein
VRTTAPMKSRNRERSGTDAGRPTWGRRLAVDTDQVARGIAHGADAVRLLGRLLDDLGAAGLLQLGEGAVEVGGGQENAGGPLDLTSPKLSDRSSVQHLTANRGICRSNKAGAGSNRRPSDFQAESARPGRSPRPNPCSGEGISSLAVR